MYKFSRDVDKFLGCHESSVLLFYLEEHLPIKSCAFFTTHSCTCEIFKHITHYVKQHSVEKCNV